MASPTVSIIMSMHNAADTLRAALNSLLGQTLADWNLVLIDDGSRDDSVGLAHSFADPRIRVELGGYRRGLAACLNQAMALANGRYLARMDADDVAFPERLSRQVEFLESHREVDLVGSAMTVFGDGGRPVGFYPVAATHEDICARPLAGFYLPHPTWMGKAEWFRRWGYDEVCRKAQDQDLLLRAFATSRFAAITEPLVGYRQERISLRKSLQGRYYFSRAIVKVARREHGLARAVLPILEQGAKSVVDAIAVMTGLERRILKHRARPLAHVDAERWAKVWEQAAAEGKA